MIFPLMPTWAIKLAGITLLAVALFVGYNLWAGHQQQIGEDRATTRYNVLIVAQKTAAAQKLAAETAKARAVEQSLAVEINKQEVADARNKRMVAGLTARLRDLSGPGGRLRDPNGDCGGRDRGPGSATAAAPGNSADHPTQVGGLLSAQLSGLLRQLTAEADEINNAYASSLAYGEALRAACGAADVAR